MTIASSIDLDARHKAPPRLVRFGDVAVPVSQAEHRAAAVTVRAALWMVQYWGFASVDAVAERARALAPHSGASAALVSRLLSAAPDTRWLDGPARQWFSLASHTSQLEQTIRKVLPVTTSARLQDLREGLSKAVPAIADAPIAVLQQYLQQIVRCTVEGEIVRPAEGLAVIDAILSPAEAGLVRILRKAGGTMKLSALRRRAVEVRLPEATTRRVLKISPLFLLGQDGMVRLIGREAAATNLAYVVSGPSQLGREAIRAAL